MIATIKKRDSTFDAGNPRNMFDRLPNETFQELRQMGKDIQKIIEKHYDPHTEIIIRGGEITIKRDVLNTYL